MLEALLPSFAQELVKLAAEPECICPSARLTTCPVHGNKARVAKGMPPTTPGEDKARARRLAREKQKTAGKEHKEKAEAFHTAEVKDWPGFEKDLMNRPFQRAMLGHDLTDPKLKKYVKNYGGQLTSKTIIAVAPSRTTEGKEYKVKVLPSGRLACECKDWQFHHSVRRTDCDHIKAVKQFYKAGLIKTSSAWATIGKGMKLKRRTDIALDSHRQGRELRKNNTPVTIGQR